MDELKESQLKQKTKAQLIDGFLAFKRKVNNETIDLKSQITTLENESKQKQETIEAMDCTIKTLQKELDEMKITNNNNKKTIEEQTATIAIQDKCLNENALSFLTSSRCSTPSPPFEYIPVPLTSTEKMDCTEESNVNDVQDSSSTTTKLSDLSKELTGRDGSGSDEENSEDSGDDDDEKDDSDEDDNEVKESDKYPSKTPLRLPIETTSVLETKAADTLKTPNLTLKSISKVKFNINKSINILMLGSFTKKYLKGHKRSGQGGKKGVLKRKPMEEHHLQLITSNNI
ncbi:ESF1 homolog [Daphnia pulex]|uniref:ESF1 homolog n=1 Tax=Daphnia pulex TaxID=6669 RepID=UPI001EDE61BE|nr:ESF1 homolog [Daphnia pulex]